MRFTDLKVWQEAKELVTKVYETAKNFPNEEKYDLTRKLKNAAVSAPSNIAKGMEGTRSDDVEFHFNLAKKNFAEVGSLLKLAQELGYLEEKVMEALTDNISDCQKLTYGFIRYNKSKKNGKKSEINEAEVQKPAA